MLQNNTDIHSHKTKSKNYIYCTVVFVHCIVVFDTKRHSEWRTFSNSDTPGSDPNRVGGPSNPLLRDSGLSTIIGKGDATAASLSRWQNRGAVCTFTFLYTM